jgi:hypothetical protein
LLFKTFLKILLKTPRTTTSARKQRCRETRQPSAIIIERWDIDERDVDFSIRTSVQKDRGEVIRSHVAIRAWGRKKEFQIMGYSAINKESKGSGANPSASAVIKEGVSTTTANPVQ